MSFTTKDNLRIDLLSILSRMLENLTFKLSVKLSRNTIICFPEITNTFRELLMPRFFL